MHYTAEQHLKAARQQERRARTEHDPKKRAALLQSARRHKIVATVAALRLADKVVEAKAPHKDVGGLCGGGKVSSGSTVDEDTFARALPIFRAGVARFADAGHDIAEVAKRLVKHLAQNGMDRDAIERMRPYLVRFMKDWREGVAPTKQAAESMPRAAAIVKKVPVTEQSAFLIRVEAKFRDLLQQSVDPTQEIADAAYRLMAAELLFSAPDPKASARQAAFQMIGDNEAITEIWMEIRSRNVWLASETPSELISELIPSNDHLD